MIKPALAACFLLLFALAVPHSSAIAQESPSVEEAIDSLMAPYNEAKDDASKLAICMEVLEKYPESGYTRALLETAHWHSDKLGRSEEFLPFAEKIFGSIRDTKIWTSVARFMAGLYADVGRIEKLDAIAGKLMQGKIRNFNVFYDLVEAYAKAKRWESVMEYAGEADRFATAEAYKEEYPDAKLSGEDLEKRGKTRKGLVLTYRGWAKANLGDTEAALSHYEKADNLIERTYMGFSPRELDYFWGATLAKVGRPKEALERLARKALFGEDEEAMEVMQKAYAELEGSEADFDEYTRELRARLAKPVDDFTLEGYDGDKLTLSAFKGKVVLLAFWFPT